MNVNTFDKIYTQFPYTAKLHYIAQKNLKDLKNGKVCYICTLENSILLTG
jgi:hypothetical protein